MSNLAGPLTAAVAPPVSAAFDVRGVVKRYRSRGTTVTASAGIDVRIDAGRIFGVLGPNGAGKTTLVRQLVGLSRPDAGSIRLFGHDLVGRPQLAGRFVAYLPQEDAALADLTVAQAIDTTARLRGVPRAQARAVAAGILDELNLTALARRPIGKLSGGQRRLAAFATALAGERPILVLDEPTTGLDPTARRAVWDAVERRRSGRGCTVVLVTHNVIEAETVLDDVAILDRGRVIASGTPGELKARFGDTLHVELAWRRDPPERDPLIARLRSAAQVRGRRWALRLPAPEARAVVAEVTAGPLLEFLDDFALSTPSLEDVYVAFGGHESLDRT